ncbi:MAG TPA: GntR family transcriptional regulator [Clostridia bacterium]|nr:GntR family transcriptional regulator [Clostridia bacterium]
MKYEAAREALLQRIQDMPKGERLPGRNALAEDLGIARTTLEHAISDLTTQGYLESKRGSGTYVTGKPVVPDLPNPQERWFSLPDTIALDENTWALLVSNIMADISPALLRGVEDETQRRNIHLIICNTDNDSEKLANYLFQLTKSGVSGILIMPGVGHTIDPWIWEQVRSHGVRVVSCTRALPDFVTPGVYYNGSQTGFLATQHLIERNCRRIAMVAGGRTGTLADRYSGYRTALAAYGLPALPELFSYEQGLDPIPDMPNGRALIQRGGFDGLFVFNDRMARFAYAALKQCGMMPGRDVAVVACDGTPVGEDLQPMLSSVYVPTYEVGAQAAKLLYSLCRGESGVAEWSMLDCRLIARESTLAYQPASPK